MISPVNELATVSDLRYNYQTLFKRIKKEFIVLTQHNKPKAVLVDVEQWNQTLEKIIHLEERVNTLETALEVAIGEKQPSAETRVTLEEMQAVSAQFGRPPTDAEVDAWLDEHRMGKYG